MNKFFKFFVPFFIYLGLIQHVNAGNAELSAIDSPEIDSSFESGQTIEPQVTIIRKEDNVIEEYKRNGNVYMVRVTPKVGLPYILLDYDGDGQLTLRKDELDDVLVPQWVLFAWQ